MKRYYLNNRIVARLQKIANTGQSIEPDHWVYRCMARKAAQEILEEIAVDGERPLPPKLDTGETG